MHNGHTVPLPWGRHGALGIVNGHASHQSDDVLRRTLFVNCTAKALGFELRHERPGKTLEPGAVWRGEVIVPYEDVLNLERSCFNASAIGKLEAMYPDDDCRKNDLLMTPYAFPEYRDRKSVAPMIAKHGVAVLKAVNLLKWCESGIAKWAVSNRLCCFHGKSVAVVRAVNAELAAFYHRSGLLDADQVGGDRWSLMAHTRNHAHARL